MDNNYTGAIRSRIEAALEGSVFVNSDFCDVTDPNTVKQIVNRMVKDGALRRVIRGVYEKPKYSKLLGEYLEADPDAVAKALARNYHWNIAPCGDAALNLLGLSTQVPAVWSYVSDGPYKTYRWGNIKIEFKKRANKEITSLSPITALVIQALKALGKGNVSNGNIEALSGRLDADQKTTLLAESGEATDWVYSAIKKICREV